MHDLGVGGSRNRSVSPNKMTIHGISMLGCRERSGSWEGRSPILQGLAQVGVHREGLKAALQTLVKP